jgi:hypothetical protein
MGENGAPQSASGIDRAVNWPILPTNEESRLQPMWPC